MSRYRLGIDLGGSHFEVGLVDIETGAEISSVREKVDPQLHWREHLKDIVEAISKLSENTPDLFENVSKVGIALPGNVSPRGDICYKCPNLLKWRDVPVSEFLRDLLKQYLKRDFQVVAINDVNAAAIGEYHFNVKVLLNKPPASMLYIAVGTGVGGGIVLNGKLLVGPRGLAGEIGHLPLDSSPDAPICGCGSKGCLETQASAKAITRKASERLGHNYTPRELYNLILKTPDSQEASIAKDIFREAGYFLGLGIIAVSYVVDIDVVVLGGGVMGASEYILPGIYEALDEKFKMYPGDPKDMILLGKLDSPQVLGSALALNYL